MMNRQDKYGGLTGLFSRDGVKRKKGVTQPSLTPIDVLCTPWEMMIDPKPASRSAPAHAVITWPDKTQTIIDHKTLCFFLHSDREPIDRLKNQAVDYILQHSDRSNYSRDKIQELVDLRFAEIKRTAGIVSEYARRSVERHHIEYKRQSGKEGNAGGRRHDFRI